MQASVSCAPVLFLVFNRPERTRRVFAAIREARPKQLFVAADGPRPDRPEDRQCCAEVRQLATAVDWPCEVRTLFRTQNLGCGRAVSEAISWFYRNVAEGIVLEDDCCPDPSFFDFCTAMLVRYRGDRRVFKIAGTNPLGHWSGPEGSSYIYSSYGYSWGGRAGAIAGSSSILSLLIGLLLKNLLTPVFTHSVFSVTRDFGLLTLA